MEIQDRIKCSQCGEEFNKWKYSAAQRISKTPLCRWCNPNRRQIVADKPYGSRMVQYSDSTCLSCGKQFTASNSARICNNCKRKVNRAECIV